MSEFLNNNILNKTGLACRLWKDKHPDILRRRLEAKVMRKTLTGIELETIRKEIQQLAQDFESFINNM